MKNELKNKIIYQVFARNFTKEGTFKAFNKHIDYIKNLGVDIIYFTPINEIGLINRKGDLGSPYSIKDYYKINPELGTIEDFIDTINQIHHAQMKVMIDVVFNHTSHDSILRNLHPEWFYKDKDGNITSKCSDWSDVIDLDYRNNSALVDYIINVIKYYINLGVDGFRFDVASLIGLNLYKKIKEEILSTSPNIIMLAEAIDPNFTNYIRSQNLDAIDDATLFNTGFDLLYEYNAWNYLREYLETKDLNKLTSFKVLKSYEFAFNPNSSMRIRGIENHDQKRICEFTNSKLKQRNLLAMSFYMVGPMFIYNGLETKADHHLSLFTKDLLDLSIDKKWFNFVKKIINIKKDITNLNIIFSEVDTTIGEFLIFKNIYNNSNYGFGIFNLKVRSQIIKSNFLIDGVYKNLLDDKTYEIKNNQIKVNEPLYLIKIN